MLMPVSSCGWLDSSGLVVSMVKLSGKYINLNLWDDDWKTPPVLLCVYYSLLKINTGQLHLPGVSILQIWEWWERGKQQVCKFFLQWFLLCEFCVWGFCIHFAEVASRLEISFPMASCLRESFLQTITWKVFGHVLPCSVYNFVLSRA